MTDISNLRTPAWRRVVEELTADAPTATTFLARLCSVLTRVANARQGSIVLVPPSDGEQSSAEPSIAYAVAAGEPQDGRPGEPARIDPAQVEHAAWVRSAAAEAVRGREARVFALGSGSGSGAALYGQHAESGAVIAGVIDLPLGGPTAAICLTIEQRSKEATQTTMALVEVLCGYARLHAARQEAKGAWQASAALDLAGRLIASINEANGFKGACLQMVNDVARAASADRVALGWIKGVGDSGVVRVQALSDTEHVDRRLHMVRLLQAAMEECFDQAHAVVYPMPSVSSGPDATNNLEPDPTLTAAVTHAHRQLTASDARLKAASLPIRAGERVVGVITIELSEQEQLSPAKLELLQATLDLVGPVIELRRSDDRPIPQRGWHAMLKAGAWLVGPRHTAWKVAALVALLVLGTIVFVKIPYRIDAQAELMPVQERAVAAPFAGLIASVPESIRPGAQVSAGQVLLEMDTTELLESRLDAQTSVNTARREADEARKQGDLNATEQALGRLEQELARLRYIDLQIRRATILAPIDGTIISGDPRRMVGSAINIGEPIFRVANLDQLEVVARVKDNDIGYVSAQSIGGFATRARPGERFRFRADSLVPIGQPDEGSNIFQLRGTIEDPPDWLRPGMEGIAYIDTGDKRIIWILSRRLIDTARLVLWY